MTGRPLHVVHFELRERVVWNLAETAVCYRGLEGGGGGEFGHLYLLPLCESLAKAKYPASCRVLQGKTWPRAATPQPRLSIWLVGARAGATNAATGSAQEQKQCSVQQLDGEATVGGAWDCRAAEPHGPQVMCHGMFCSGPYSTTLLFLRL
jgi:hypothetical protein